MLTVVAPHRSWQLSIMLVSLSLLTVADALNLPSLPVRVAIKAQSELSLLGEGSQAHVLLPKDSHWFQSFSEGESTYDDDADNTSPANPMHHYMDGWEPTLGNPYEPLGKVVRPEKFHESLSANWEQAWQTFYPAIQEGIAGHGVDLGKWTQNAGGSYTQNYHVAQGNHFGPLLADWFDSSVDQVDGFGRQKEPSPLSARRYITWEERSVNTTLTCADPGCVAEVALQAFNGITEQARNCRLNFAITPTDFDDEYSLELLEYVTVNDVLVDFACDPHLSGCNETTQRQLFQCARQVNLDSIVNPAGTLRISAKINDVVDECPYEGNMLHAIAQVTCLVNSKQAPPIFPENVPEIPEGPNITLAECAFNTTNTTYSAQCPFACIHRGCTAFQTIEVPQAFLNNSNCQLNVVVNQTDYDGDQGSTEAINFIALNGNNITTNVLPGQNPCLASYQGSPLPAADLQFTAVSNYQVDTADLPGGILMMSAQITQLVDECASNGYLFAADLSLSCTLS